LRIAAPRVAKVERRRADTITVTYLDNRNAGFVSNSAVTSNLVD
jgi:hypothetical protein